MRRTVPRSFSPREIPPPPHPQPPQTLADTKEKNPNQANRDDSRLPNPRPGAREGPARIDNGTRAEPPPSLPRGVRSPFRFTLPQAEKSARSAKRISRGENCAKLAYYGPAAVLHKLRARLGKRTVPGTAGHGCGKR